MDLKEVTGAWAKAGWREPVDLHRMQKECLAKTLKSMEDAELDALVLFREENAHYVSGTRHLAGIPAVAFFFPIVAVVVKGDDPYVFTTDADGVPYWLDSNHVSGPLFVELDGDARECARRVKDILGNIRDKRIGLDMLNPAVWRIFPQELAGAELVDGQEIMMRARRTKTVDELGCLLIAEQASEAAMADVYGALRPGIRGVDLNKLFLGRLTELGLNWSGMEGVYCAMPEDYSDVPAASRDTLPYRKLTTDVPFKEGDMVVVDVAALYEGYISDFGRTWWCGFGRPTSAHRDLCKRWMETADRMLDVLKPGATAADLHRAAGSNITSYVAHGLGHGVEPPLVGGPAMRLEDEEQDFLEPGNVIVIEPYVWEEGVGGFRAETTCVVVDDGYQVMTTFTHGALAAGDE